MACVLSLVLCASCLVAFAEDETIELTYWAHSGTKDSVEPLTAAYMAEHPNVKIDVSYYATDNIKDALKVAATSNTLPSLWFNWGGNLGGYYVTNGCTYDLTQFAKEHGWTERFNAGALDLCTLDGKLSGYPTSISMLTMYYKKSVFERCGVEVPTTFEELEAVCDKLKENGVVPFATAGLYGWHLMRIVEQLVEYYAGPELHNQLLQSSRFPFYNAEYYKVLPFIVELRNKGEKNVNEIETCLNALYGTMMLRLQNKKISPDTEHAIKEISTFIGMLSDYYIKDKNEGLKFEEE